MLVLRVALPGAAAVGAPIVVEGEDTMTVDCRGVVISHLNITDIISEGGHS